MLSAQFNRVVVLTTILRRNISLEASKFNLVNTDNKVFVVNTCSRGIGYEFTRQLLERSSSSARVVGLYRSRTPKMESLKAQHQHKLELIHVDLERQSSIDNAAIELSKLTNKIDILINSAGILGDGKSLPGPERTIASIDRAWLEKSLQTNLIGHVMVTQALIPLMKQSSTHTKSSECGVDDLSRIVNVSARVGSITDNSLGGWYSYRMSKAALNMFTKTCSVELRRHNCVVLSIHPGTTDTDLSIPFQKNVLPGKLFPVEYSVSCMLDVIWESTLAETGNFFAYDGTKIPF